MSFGERPKGGPDDDGRGSRRTLRPATTITFGGRPRADQVKTALAIHLFLEGLISIGKAAELAGEPRVNVKWLLVEMGLPTVRYDLADDEQDQRDIAEAERGRHAS